MPPLFNSTHTPDPSVTLGKAEGASKSLKLSSARGSEISKLLDIDVPVLGVTKGRLRTGIGAIAVPNTVDGSNMGDDDFALTARWGYLGASDAVMPGQGRVVERPYTEDERKRLGTILPALGKTTFDIYMNEVAYWKNVPTSVWSFRLGGYEVLKKWLSYREHEIIDRALTADETQQFSDVARRIASLLAIRTT